jgi:hypothetical protein
MPNHCCNTLVMSELTLPVIIDNYIRKDENGNGFFDFERIVPIGDIPGWYEQRLEKWGTAKNAVAFLAWQFCAKRKTA